MKRKKIGLFVLLSVILFGYAGTVDYTEALSTICRRLSMMGLWKNIPISLKNR